MRTAWLYGVHGANFVKTMLALEATKPEISVVDDQRGQPTWSRDLARQIVMLLDSAAPAGIYHGTSSGETTWFEFTREIYLLIGAEPERVHPTTTDAFPRPAPRPAYSVLGHDRWATASLAPIRDWHEALAEALPLIRGVIHRAVDRVRRGLLAALQARARASSANLGHAHPEPRRHVHVGGEDLDHVCVGPDSSALDVAATGLDVRAIRSRASGSP